MNVGIDRKGHLHSPDMSLSRRLGPKLPDITLVENTPLYFAVMRLGGKGGKRKAAEKLLMTRQQLDEWLWRGKVPIWVDDNHHVMRMLTGEGEGSVHELRRGLPPEVISAFQSKRKSAKK